MSQSPQPSGNREREIFLEAIEKATAAERAAFLEGACRGDAALRAAVEALLANASNPLLDQVAADARPTIAIVPVTEKPGDHIGRYKLLEKIGEGGCGVVFMAEQQEPVRRQVALKIIKPGMDSKSVIARFEAKRQALALMDHPNIAKIFDAGVTGSGESEISNSQSQSHGGRPYFVMELVRGIRITDYCEQHNLSTSARLGLLIQVCQAVQHAHQKGIIHRDLKPSNILVSENDGTPVPKVIDFGIAKATEQKLTDKTLFTQFAQFIGTPAYMSPEQAAMTVLDIDTRSDIYSLGVLLYELLTGTTPFDQKELLAAGFDEMRRTIREVEPVKPSTRLTQELGRIGTGSVRGSRASVGVPAAGNDAGCGASEACAVACSVAVDEASTAARGARALPRSALRTPHSAVPSDLDWIVMKCLEKDRARRYETANGLAADLKRHLGNEPVVARPPSAAYRLQKLVRRNRLAFAAGSAVGLALVLGLGVSLWILARERRAVQRAIAAEQAARLEATQREKVARFLGEIATGAMPESVEGADTVLLRDILDQARERLQASGASQPGELWNLGLAYQGLGDLARAETLVREALQSGIQTWGAGSASVREFRNELVDILLRQGKPQQAEYVLEEALNLAAEGTTERTALLASRGSIRARQGKWKDAAADFQKALEQEPDSHELHHSLAPLLIQSGEVQGYLKLRQTLLRRFAATTDPIIAERMAKDCLLLPIAMEANELADAWTETAIQAGSQHPAWKWFQLARALAEFRREQFASAVDWAQQLTSSAGEDVNRDVQAFAVLAMAQHQLGQKGNAAAALSKASELASHHLPKPGSADLGASWGDWIIAHMLLREARQLIASNRLSGKEDNELSRP
jgi:serine/threonine protein kinase/predicted Zn-dependent protease